MAKKEEDISEWDKINEDNPVLLSEFDLKGHMMKDERREARNITDFLRKSLQNSNIPKREVPIFRMQMECILSWFTMGFKDEIANEEFIELQSELSINKSVGGFNAVLNLGDVGANVVMQPGQAAELRMGYDQQYEEQQEGLPQKMRKQLLGR